MPSIPQSIWRGFKRGAVLAVVTLALTTVLDFYAVLPPDYAIFSPLIVLGIGWLEKTQRNYREVLDTENQAELDKIKTAVNG